MRSACPETGNDTASISSSSARARRHHAGEEILRRHPPAPFGAAQMHLASERTQHQRQFGAGVGMRDRSADGAPAPGLDVAGPWQRQRYQLQAVAKFRPFEQSGLADARPDRHRSAVAPDAIEVGKPHDVDQGFWLGQPHVEHRHQRLSAGDDAGIAAFLAEHAERLVEMFGAHVVEGGGLHDCPPNRRRIFVNRETRAASGAAPPAVRASEAKNCPIITRAAPSSRRPPMLASLPPIAAS